MVCIGSSATSIACRARFTRKANVPSRNPAITDSGTARTTSDRVFML
jgi:hypothetical protein